MAIGFVFSLFIQMGLVYSPNIDQSADGHAMSADIFGPKKKNKETQQEGDDGGPLHAAALARIFQDLGMFLIHCPAAMQADPVSWVEFLDMAAVGTLNVHDHFIR
ncbi:MAG: hypothetical protein NTZ12_05465 [Candidatus Aminicenantes bacterium]|nr:hypothetical protein [Candidatus Aminicenantes bacterium]